VTSAMWDNPHHHALTCYSKLLQARPVGLVVVSTATLARPKLPVIPARCYSAKSPVEARWTTANSTERKP
jgi:hypothetical protein